MRVFLAKLIKLTIDATEKLKRFLKRFSRRTYSTVAVILVCAILLLDVGYHFSKGFTSSLETMSARVGTLGETVSFDAFLVRKEKTIGNASSKNVYYVADGERVKNGMPLMATYPDGVNDESLATLTRAKQAISILESVNDARPEKVSETIELRIAGVSLAIEEAIRNGNVEKANRQKDTLAALMLAREKLNGLADLSKALADLTQAVKTMEKNLGEPTRIITAEESGWFAHSVDGYEAVASAENVKGLDYEALADLFDEERSVTPSGAGKMITSHKVYAIAFVDNDFAASFVLGRQYSVAVEDGNLSLTLEKTIRQDDESRTALIFSSLALTESLAMKRITSMTLTVETHEGFKIPTSAYTVYKGVHGVFILKGFVVQFREISVVYRKDSMMIADPSPKDKSGLFKLLSDNDNIIIKGEDLYDGKIIQGAS